MVILATKGVGGKVTWGLPSHTVPTWGFWNAGAELWAFLLEGRTVEGWAVTPKALHCSCSLGFARRLIT